MSRMESIKTFLRESPWQLWTEQLVSILRIELKKNFFKRRGIWIYLLMVAPALPITIHALMSPGGRHCSIGQDTRVMVLIFQMLYLRLIFFFGCMGLFTWLFRGEIVEKSLHYYFLSPVRRELLVLGKFLAATITAVFFFGLSVALSFAIMYGHHGAAGSNYVFNGPGFGQLVQYLGITLLACMGYGALFIGLSLLTKNPIVPAIFLLGWETFHPVFPSILQKLSVMFYLKQLCPVPVPPEDMTALFAVMSEPVSAWLAVPGLLLLAALLLVFACLRVRKMEISYLAD